MRPRPAPTGAGGRRAGREPMAKITFVQPQSYAYPGMFWLAGAIRQAGHDYSVCVSESPRQVLRHIAREEPDLVGFSVMTGLYRTVRDLATRIKGRFDVPIVLGGPHATFMPAVVDEPFVDIVCRGEGERPLASLLDAFEAGAAYDRIPNLWVKTPAGVVRNAIAPFVRDLDELPPCDYSVYDQVPVIRGQSIPNIYLGRGCPFGCTYCHMAVARTLFKGLGAGRIRWPSPDRILDEVAGLLEHFPRARCVLLGAETWGSDVPFAREVLGRYSERFRVPYAIGLRPELVTDDMVEVLRTTRCHVVGFGLEAGSHRVRREILGRDYTDDVALAAAERLHAAGITFRTFNILGHPTETVAELFETVELNRRMRVPYPYCSTMVPFPGTPMWQLCVREGLLPDGLTLDDFPTSFFGKTVIRSDHQRLVTNLQSFFQTLVVFPRLDPLVRLLMTLPPNPLYRAWFFAVWGFVAMRLEQRSLAETALSGVKNLRYMSPGRGWLAALGDRLAGHEAPPLPPGWDAAVCAEVEEG